MRIANRKKASSDLTSGAVETIDEQFRRNILMGISLTLSLLIVVGTIVRHLASPMPPRILIANGIIAVIFALSPILGRNGKSPNLMAWVFFLGFIVLVGNGGMVAGGINAPICAFIPLFPVLGFCFGGKKLGIAGLVISFGLVGGLVFADSRGWAGEVLDPATVGLQRASNLVAILFASFAVGYIYETSRTKAERRLVEMSRLASLGTMAGGIAHEINNPLTILMGYSSQLDQLSKSKEPCPLVIEKLANRIELTTNRIAKIVSGLRTYARDETSEGLSEVRLSAIVSSALSLCGQRFKSANIIVRLDNVADDWINVRQSQVTEVVLNVLNNAFDAVVGQHVRWVDISSTTSDDFLELSITDSGNGIPDYLQSKIFIPFFTTKQVGRGIGLGLSTSSSIMVQHGGGISLDPRSPNTRFVMRFKKHKPLKAVLNNDVAS